jgi:hypothetical protein
MSYAGFLYDEAYEVVKGGEELISSEDVIHDRVNAAVTELYEPVQLGYVAGLGAHEGSEFFFPVVDVKPEPGLQLGPC